MGDPPGAATFRTPAEAFAPSGAYATSLPPGRRAALEAELRRRLGAGDEPFRLTARAWIATGRAA